MKRFSTMMGFAAIAFLVAAGVAVAQGPGPHCPDCPLMHGMSTGMGHGMGHAMGPGMGPGPGMAGHSIERLADALDLTEEQRASLGRLHDELMSTVQPLMERKHTAMKQLHDAIDAGSTDACALGQLVLDAHGNDAAIEAAHDRFKAGVVAMLTPEQATRLDAIKSFVPHFGHGRSGGDGPEG